jgi:hypothetical protein
VVRIPGAARGLFFKTPSGSTQNSIKWVRVGAVSLGVKQPDRKADYTSPSSAEVTSRWSCTTIFPIRLNGLYRHSFTFTSSPLFCVCFTFYLECTACRVIFVLFALLKAVVLTSPVSSERYFDVLTISFRCLYTFGSCIHSVQINQVYSIFKITTVCIKFLLL